LIQNCLDPLQRSGHLDTVISGNTRELLINAATSHIDQKKHPVRQLCPEHRYPGEISVNESDVCSDLESAGALAAECINHGGIRLKTT